MMTMRTLAQERSEFALNRVLAHVTLKRLKPFSASAPSMILQNGFGQALAFWKAKGKEGDNEQTALFEMVRSWLVEKGFANGNDAQRFLMNLSTMDQRQYLSAQKETLNLLEWVKRYAGAFIEDPDES